METRLKVPRPSSARPSIPAVYEYVGRAQRMAAHEGPRTTKLYDRTNDSVTLDEVEKVVF